MPMNTRVVILTGIVITVIVVVIQVVDSLIIRKAGIPDLLAQLIIDAILWLPVVVLALWFAFRRRKS